MPMLLFENTMLPTERRYIKSVSPEHAHPDFETALKGF
jgi:hypothetical protein